MKSSPLIGRGGMGEVYRARDTSLDRDVALKVLPRDVARDPVRLERFLREAKMVAGLNHPHIVTLHSVEESGGIHFLVMELVDGQPLDVSLQAAEAMPIKKVIEIGIAVADALAAAHEKGIIHRDLKPANVMITRDGRAKVLDFGIAKTAPHDLGATETSSALTGEGMVMGTIPYMSPEQVRGGRVDRRSDIFSLGTMLYQLATGVLPFHGDYDHAIGYAIVNTSPRPIAELRSDVPAALVAIIDKCLAKDPAQRYSSAAVIRDELRTLQTQTGSRLAKAATPRGRRTWIGIASLVVIAGVAAYLLMGRHAAQAQSKSIAVLPFMNMSGDASQDYFSDGISEELLNLLAQIPNLKVAARTSSFSFRGKDVEVPEIGRRLNVSHVLEGSVRRSGNQVRITAQLVQASDGYHVWSQTYDRTLNDVFTTQDEIAADVVKQLKVTFLGEAPKARITDPQAYALFLQARDLARQLTRGRWSCPTRSTRLRLEIDSTYARPWVGLSSNYVNEISFGNMRRRRDSTLQAAAALKALELDPDNGLRVLPCSGSLPCGRQRSRSGREVFPARPRPRPQRCHLAHEHGTIPAVPRTHGAGDGGSRQSAGAGPGQRETSCRTWGSAKSTTARLTRASQDCERAGPEPRTGRHALRDQHRLRPESKDPNTALKEMQLGNRKTSGVAVCPSYITRSVATRTPMPR
jgi:non-specific serine/threonine protein kinase